MPDTTVLGELRRIAADDSASVGEATFRRLMLAAMQETLDKVTSMSHKIDGNGKPGIEARLSRLEWVVGVAASVLGVVFIALVGAVLSGRIQITFIP